MTVSTLDPYIYISIYAYVVPLRYIWTPEYSIDNWKIFIYIPTWSYIHTCNSSYIYLCEPPLISETPDLQNIYIYIHKSIYPHIHVSIYQYIQISICVKPMRYLKLPRYLLPLIYRTRQNYIYIYIHISMYPNIFIYTYIHTSIHLILISIDETHEILATPEIF